MLSISWEFFIFLGIVVHSFFLLGLLVLSIFEIIVLSHCRPSFLLLFFLDLLCEFGLLFVDWVFIFLFFSFISFLPRFCSFIF